MSDVLSLLDELEDRGLRTTMTPADEPAFTMTPDDEPEFSFWEPRTRLTSTTKSAMPTNGPAYRDFEEAVGQAADADQADVVTAYVFLYRQQTSGATAASVADYRALLERYVTDFRTWRDS